MTEPTVPVVVLDDTAQAADIAASEGPNEIFSRGGRIKQYVKDDALGYPWDVNPRRLAFDQPFQWGSQVTGRPWRETNLAYMKEVAECNLDCDYCLAKGALNGGAPTVDVTPTEYLVDFCMAVHARRQAGQPDPAICRISGGEPFLYQEWLVALLENGGPWDYTDWGEEDDDDAHEHFTLMAPLMSSALWIDTNLTQMPSGELLELLSRYTHPDVAVCGCFKHQVPLEEQLAVVRAMVEADVELFLYWPCDTDPTTDEQVYAFGNCLGELESIAHGLPLRVCPIEIRRDYETVCGDGEPLYSRSETLDFVGYGRAFLRDWCGCHYTPWEIAQPSHLVPIEAN